MVFATLLMPPRRDDGQDVNTDWVSDLGVICKQPPFGMIKAIDLATGKTLWDRPLGTSERNGLGGLPSLLPFEIGLPNNGGVLTTGSGVAFVGATTDDDFRAIDVKTGKTLWQDKLAASGHAHDLRRHRSAIAVAETPRAR
jgi:quinoprotein glucose dehydrogenase